SSSRGTARTSEPPSTRPTAPGRRLSRRSSGRGDRLRLFPGRDVLPPGAGRRAATLDQLLEASEITFDPAPIETRCGADGLDEPLRLVAERQMDERPVFAERLERDGAASLLAVLTDPADLPVGVL